VVCVERGGEEVDVEIEVCGTTATVATLLKHLDPGAPEVVADVTVWVDGRPIGAGMALADLAPLNGSTIRLRSGRPHHVLSASPACEVRVVGGLDAGARIALGPGAHEVGRHPAAPVSLGARSVSIRHAQLLVDSAASPTIVDLKSMNGTSVAGRPACSPTAAGAEDVVTVAGTPLRIGPPVVCEEALLYPRSAAGTSAIRRPPPSPLVRPGPISPPAAGVPMRDPPNLGWAAALVPLAGGLVLARFIDPRLALFALLGPAVLIGQWIEERRRYGRDRRKHAATTQAGLEELARQLADAEALEVERLRRQLPDPAELDAHIVRRSTLLWNREQDGPDLAAVSVGIAPVRRWSVPLTSLAEGEAKELVASSRLRWAPVDVALGPGNHLGVVGDRATCLATCRWVLMQLAAHHGPSDLRIAVVATADRADAWAWAALLPHCSAPAGRGRLLAHDPAGAARVAELARTLVAPGEGRDQHGPFVVVLADGDGLVDGEGATAPALIGGSRAASITLAPSRRALPRRCTAVVEVSGPDGWIDELPDGDPGGAWATGISAPRAARWARTLAGLSDQGPNTALDLPSEVRLLDLLDLAPSVPERLVHGLVDRWTSPPSVSVVIGVTAGPDGPQPFSVDLVTDGPHALVAGTTGAGKSELLRTLVAGLAISAPPDRLNFLLIDYKGGAAFGDCVGLPHVVGVVTDLDEGGATRALHSLEAELRRRERIFATIGLGDIAQHPHHGAPSPTASPDALARLVIVVDELAALVAELPELVDGLVSVAARGRSLGIHLVLGTQRPAGVVSAAIRTNCALRICLRVPDDADAIDVVGMAEPARLDRRQAGRAFVRRGAADVYQVQVALASAATPAGEGLPLCVRPLCLDPDPWLPNQSVAVAHSGLDALVSACRAAAELRGCVAPAAPWCPPLPDVLTLDAMITSQVEVSAQELPGSDVVAFGLLDDPARQRHRPLAWDMARGPLIAFGATGGGARALYAVALASAASTGPDDLHIHCIEAGAAALPDLAGLPHVGTVVGAGEAERIHRLLRMLRSEVLERQSAPSPVGFRRPRVLVLLNGAGGLRAALEGLDGLLALDAFERVVVDGPAVGIAVAVSADRPGSVPAPWSSAAALRLAFRLGDPTDLLTLAGGRVDQSGWPDGRCLDLSTGLVGQVVAGDVPTGQRRGPRRRPAPDVEALPDDVDLSPIIGSARTEGGAACMAIGIAADDLGPVEVRISPRRGLLVVGGPGSGRSTALCTVGLSAAAAGCEVISLGAPPHGPDERPLVLIVDDAESGPEPPELRSLLAGTRPVIVVAATGPENLTHARTGWLDELRRSAVGLVLRPRSDFDGDVVGLPLLPRTIVALDRPGRGVLVDGGAVTVLQIARACT